MRVVGESTRRGLLHRNRIWVCILHVLPRRIAGGGGGEANSTKLLNSASVSMLSVITYHQIHANACTDVNTIISLEERCVK